MGLDLDVFSICLYLLIMLSFVRLSIWIDCFAFAMDVVLVSCIFIVCFNGLHDSIDLQVACSFMLC